MPKALSVHPEPYRHHWTPAAKYDEIYTGWTYPPKDYAKWSELVYQWARHAKERYGVGDVERWYWETWNEPNIGYWHGTRQEFYKLHDYAVAGVRRAIPNAQVGGPDTAGGGGYFSDFLEHCMRGTNAATGGVGTPLNFVSFHAKGAPEFVDGHVRMGPSAQLKTIEEAFRRIASFPKLKGTPVVIGESDPDACAACQGPNLGYRNDTMYASYTAAVNARELDLAAKHGVNLMGSLSWAFTFEDQPLFAGFRQLATGGIDLPVVNLFRMYSRMGGQRIAASSSAEQPLDSIVANGVRNDPDVGVLASRKGKSIAVMVWRHRDDDVPGPNAKVDARVSGLGGTTVRVTEYRIDRSHSNAFTAWKAMGSPVNPTRQQHQELTRAGRLQISSPPHRIPVMSGVATFETILPRSSVSLLIIEP